MVFLFFSNENKYERSALSPWDSLAYSLPQFLCASAPLREPLFRGIPTDSKGGMMSPIGKCKIAGKLCMFLTGYVICDIL